MHRIISKTPDGSLDERVFSGNTVTIGRGDGCDIVIKAAHRVILDNLRRHARRAGQSMTEFIIIVAAIAVGAILIYAQFGDVSRNQVGAAAKAVAGLDGSSQTSAAQNIATAMGTNTRRGMGDFAGGSYGSGPGSPGDPGSPSDGPSGPGSPGSPSDGPSGPGSPGSPGGPGTIDLSGDPEPGLSCGD